MEENSAAGKDATGLIREEKPTDDPGEALSFQHFSVPIVDGHPVELGRGAMGITYKAYDRNLHVSVALKVINSAVLNGESARERFLREARSAAALRHPNVAAVFYLGEQEGSVFYAMEFVDGETIEACIRREIGMPPVMALKVVAQVASALAAAEKEGIIHRDIKPSNIMLAKSGEDELLVKVIDFGLAKSIASHPESATVTLTQGGFLGTPHFASPEQLEEGEVDTRSDIYSLGVTLFYMLAGKTPFSGSMAQVMSQHLYRQPPLELLKDQPPALMELLAAMLAKLPQDRPQTAVELRRRVEACLEELSFTGIGTPAYSRGPGGPLGAGEVIGGRFTLDERIGSVGEFLRFRARDGERSDEIVEVVVVDPLATMVPGLRDEVRQRVMVAERLPAPAIRKVIAQGGSGRNWFFAVEREEGVSLLDVMRARRGLTLAEALLVLRPIAGVMDALDQVGAARPDLAPHEIRLAPAADPATPLRSWPSLAVKVDALRLRHLLDLPADHTVVQSSAAVLRKTAGGERETAAFAVAGLAYELLGGARFDALHDHWTPLSGLTQDGNLVIQRALAADSDFGTALAFVEALAAEEGTSAPAAASLPVAAVSGPTSSPPDRRSPAPRVIAGALLGAAALVAAGIFWFGSRDRIANVAPPPSDSATPAPTAPPLPTPRVVSEPNQAPPPPGKETRPARSAAEFARARELETAGNDGAAMEAYAKLTREYPEDPDFLGALKQVAQKIETNYPKGLHGPEFDRLRPGLEAAGWLGSENAEIVLGYSLLDLDPAGSLQWFQEAGKHGRSDAMAIAGMMLSSGRGISKPDEAGAVGWFQAAADRNDVNGITYLGECYSRGFGVPLDYKRAIELLTTSAEMGDDRAMNLLGGLYDKGLGVEKPDLQKAFDLYRRSAAAGNFKAQANLGVLYAMGRGVAPDPVEAVRLWKEGAEKGDMNCMFLYAQSLEDPKLANRPELARDWYVKAARAGHKGAAAWCRDHEAALDLPAASASPGTP